MLRTSKAPPLPVRPRALARKLPLRPPKQSRVPRVFLITLVFLVASICKTASAAPCAFPPTVTVIGTSVKGTPIRAYTFGHGGDVTFLLGGFHGDEPSGTALLERFRGELERRPELTEGRTVIVVPVVNPDGLSRGTRANAHGVDLNRNFPTRNWKRSTGGPRPASEPETQALLHLLTELRPARIVTVHAAAAEVNFDGPAEGLARAMSTACSLPASDDIGYPTPGSFGTYVGKERGIPTITLELEHNRDGGASAAYRAALLTALFFID